ncbi:MAG TPA: polysaccharide biosynthesis/export family protein [Pyrinomonadaceae bacterium]|nr:polysaccharide biosynthesis/export family protein [Pyrinomonadaceae bacterium]
MKKLLTQILVLASALTIAVSTLAQSPAATRQRRISPIEKTESSALEQPSPPAEVTDEAETNRVDSASEEAAIVPYYNKFFTTYRLGPEDVVSVNVFGQDRYSKQGIVIPPSGRIYLALVPEGLFVNGKTCDQVAELIKKKYNEYIIDPQVSVSLDRAGSYRYSVIGDVGQPGIRLMTRRLSVTEAIAEAGGILQTGSRSKVYVLRKQANGTLQPIPVNVSAIYKGQAPDSVYLIPGDQVVVPGNKFKKWQTLTSFLPILSFARLFTGGF